MGQTWFILCHTSPSHQFSGRYHTRTELMLCCCYPWERYKQDWITEPLKYWHVRETALVFTHTMIIYQNLQNWEVLLPSQHNAAIKATETGERATQIVSYLWLMLHYPILCQSVTPPKGLLQRVSYLKMEMRLGLVWNLSATELMQKKKLLNSCAAPHKRHIVLSSLLLTLILSYQCSNASS